MSLVDVDCLLSACLLPSGSLVVDFSGTTSSRGLKPSGQSGQIGHLAHLKPALRLKAQMWARATLEIQKDHLKSNSLGHSQSTSFGFHPKIQRPMFPRSNINVSKPETHIFCNSLRSSPFLSGEIAQPGKTPENLMFTVCFICLSNSFNSSTPSQATGS